ncbi:metalloregulator ArsR/SmtB family transcription factor [Niallia circulans]|uniref:ArsR/SmtB family transcription factor n=1 Tax=Niallia circulans TaxID=1397 RepID=UPI0039780FBF
MKVFSATGRKQETYQVEMNYSLLWECALGIAAITNERLLDSLDQPKSYWENVRTNLPQNLQAQLDYVEANNTWKALLQLLHQQDFASLDVFTEYINKLTERALIYQCIPFISESYQPIREQAAARNREAIEQLKEATKDNPFFPTYISFICQVDSQQLKQHLITVMSGWYEAVIEPDREKLTSILQTDVSIKEKMRQKMDPEEFVEWATGGIQYTPEPSVHKVLLIPQYIYRPWNITADIEGTKVYYYPVSNESISPSDKYMPSNFLVLKHKALGDEVRLRMVKLLFEQSRTLQDITEKLEMGKSTIHHHLKILRSAQLVGIEDGKYVLKRSAITSLAKELEQYIQQ